MWDDFFGTSFTITALYTVYGFGDSEESTQFLSEVTLPEGGSLNLTFKPFKNDVQARRFIAISSAPFAGTSECSYGVCRVYLLTWFLAGSSGYSVQSGDSITNDSIVFRLTSQNDKFAVVMTAESDDVAIEPPMGFHLMASLESGLLLENEYIIPPLIVNILDTNSKDENRISHHYSCMYVQCMWFVFQL